MRKYTKRNGSLNSAAVQTNYPVEKIQSAPEISDELLKVVSSDVFTVGAAALGTPLKMKIRTELVWKSVNLLP